VSRILYSRGPLPRPVPRVRGSTLRAVQLADAAQQGALKRTPRNRVALQPCRIRGVQSGPHDRHDSASGEVSSMGKPSKSSLSSAGSVLASNGSSKPAKSKAGSTLGKG